MQPNMRTIIQSSYLLIACVSASLTALADASLPPAPGWDNPAFVQSFLGFYGFLSEREPQIT